ncbi:MAG TPA: histidine kinase [Polyangiaceae bacterium]
MTSTTSVHSAPAELASVPNVHIAGRALPNLVILWILGTILVAGLSVPAISAGVGVEAPQGMLAVGSFLLVSSLAFLAYNRLGADSRVFRCLDYLESLVVTGCIAYLIYASGTARSFFWIFYLVHALLAGFASFSLLYVLTLSVAPAWLTGLFFLRGDSVSAWLSALGGLCGLVVYANVTRLYSAYVAAVQREAQLRDELARAFVARERTRISRDLHDSVTTELTALVWKVRELSETVPASPGKQHILGIAERLRGVIGDVRSVVMALRSAELDFGELKHLLVSRVRELCGSRRLSVEVDGELTDGELSSFQAHVLPICFELVHNAVTHSGAAAIQLRMQIGSALQIRVQDDGAGLSEGVWLGSQRGLSGVRARVARLHGRIELRSGDSGACFDVEIPRPLRYVN